MKREDMTMKEKWTQISTNACVVTKGISAKKIDNIIKHTKSKNYEDLKKSADATADAKAKYDAQLLQAFKDKKLKSKTLIKEAQALKKEEDKKNKAVAAKAAKKEKQSK